jgi:hypothetical protein
MEAVLFGLPMMQRPSTSVSRFQRTANRSCQRSPASPSPSCLAGNLSLPKRSAKACASSTLATQNTTGARSGAESSRSDSTVR